jgi:peroxiredoxin
MRLHISQVATGLLLWIVTNVACGNQLGQQAPNFELPSQRQTIRLQDYKGKLLYIDFWASWCGPCKQSFPWMNEVSQKYKSQGFELLAISVDKKIEDAKAFERVSRVSFDIAYDTQGVSPKAYEIKTMPTSFLIGRDGRVLRVHSGFHPKDRIELEALIKSELESK